MRAVRLDATGDITPSEIGATNQAIKAVAIARELAGGARG
jgi:stage V sporulation protein SpoVS